MRLYCAPQEERSSRRAADPLESSDSEKPLLIAHYLYIQVRSWTLVRRVRLCCSWSISSVSSDGILWKKHFKRHHRPGPASGRPSPLEALQGDSGRSVLHPWTGQPTISFYIYAFSRRFYPKRLTIAFRLYIFISMCVPWEAISSNLSHLDVNKKIFYY